LLFDLAGDHDAIMVPAEVGHRANGFERVLPQYEGTRLHPLKTAEDLQQIFAVIRDVRRLQVDADVAELLDDVPAGCPLDVNWVADHACFRRSTWTLTRTR
jgi:hypothetical protein